jgi:hypothetical protein
MMASRALIGRGWPKTGARCDELRRRLVVDEALEAPVCIAPRTHAAREGLVGP